jgi:hypothetical protein
MRLNASSASRMRRRELEAPQAEAGPKDSHSPVHARRREHAAGAINLELIPVVQDPGPRGRSGWGRR